MPPAAYCIFKIVKVCLAYRSRLSELLAISKTESLVDLMADFTYIWIHDNSDRRDRLQLVVLKLYFMTRRKLATGVTHLGQLNESMLGSPATKYRLVPTGV